MTTTCPVAHDTLSSRYCHECGSKISQPLQDLRAHCMSQLAKADAQSRDKARDKWKSWVDALDAQMHPTTTTS